MLLLFRKIGETIFIDTPSGQIKLTVVALYQNGVKLGISAPSEFNIYREELLKQLQQASLSALESGDQKPIEVEFKTSTLKRLASKLRTQLIQAKEKSHSEGENVWTLDSQDRSEKSSSIPKSAQCDTLSQGKLSQQTKENELKNE